MLAIHRRFDAILSTYDLLGDLVLFTLRAELRCSVMHYCEVSMSKVRVISPVMPPLLTCSKYQGNYRIENEADEPDPYILDLTADLGECHGVMMSKLPEEDIRQVDSGEIECLLTFLDSTASYSAAWDPWQIRSWSPRAVTCGSLRSSESTRSNAISWLSSRRCATLRKVQMIQS
jgi:hypothetical protein